MSDVVVRRAGSKGYGLFARGGGTVASTSTRAPIVFRRGDVVATMRTPVHVDLEAALDHFRTVDPRTGKARRPPLPHDIGLRVRGGWVYDAGWSHRRVPHWWRMNHGWAPNTEPRLRAGGGIAWVAKASIRAGDELTWHYGEPDPDWA